MTRHLHDDLGHPVDLDGVARVVSLVPSLTEAVAATAPGLLVGATDWCTHPADLDVTRVRGTKNPRLATIRALAPDLVIANQEENRELDVRRLREAGVPVWVTRIETVPQALTSMRRLLIDALGCDLPDWLAEAERLYGGPPPEPTARVTIPIWRDPWMVVGRATFTGDLIRWFGWENAWAGHADRYPHVDLADLDRVSDADDTDGTDLVLLPDEPYVFTTEDGPEAFTEVPTRLVSGRLLTWYGPSLIAAHTAFAPAGQ
ncbi:helical backbone metal receptor [Janibacter sp. G1551]|uniref:helical backbone metal receptor n=1 Tax=Janibacter sp. G1551 TaxID=3420440 RepID=UPI003D066FE8